MPPMSDQQGGPSRGTFGPGHTVLAQSAFGDEAPSGGAGAVPPPTVRDPGAGVAPLDARPVAIPPPPPVRGRRGRRQGASLVTIGIVSFFVIGGGVTAVVLLGRPATDDKPAPTVEAPAPTTVAQDPSPAGSAPPGATDPPPAPTPPIHRPRSPGRPPRPKTGPGNPRHPGQKRPPPPSY
jgi:hypothetical protein